MLRTSPRAALRLFSGLALAIAAQSARADLIIDPFESGNFTLSTSTPNQAPSATQSPLADVLGGQRRVELNLHHTGTMTGSLDTDANDNAIHFTYQTPILQSSGTIDHASVKYGAAAPLNLNLNTSGHDRFQITFAGPGRAGPQIRVDGISGFALAGLTATASPDVYAAPFSNFGAFDFSQVHAITLSFSLGPLTAQQPFTRDFAVTDFRVVPEPAFTLAPALWFLRRPRRGRRNY